MKDQEIDKYTLIGKAIMWHIERENGDIHSTNIVVRNVNGGTSLGIGYVVSEYKESLKTG